VQILDARSDDEVAQTLTEATETLKERYSSQPFVQEYIYYIFNCVYSPMSVLYQRFRSGLDVGIML